MTDKDMVDQYAKVARELLASVTVQITLVDSDESITRLNVAACQALATEAEWFLKVVDSDSPFSPPYLEKAATKFLATLAAFGPLSGL
jgi:hypothetical protein